MTGGEKGLLAERKKTGEGMENVCQGQDLA